MVMEDATGMPQSCVVLGGGSDLARALLRQLAARRLTRVLLAGPNSSSLEPVADELRTLGVASVETEVFDVRDVGDHEALAAKAAARLSGIDLVVVASGVLGHADIDRLSPSEVGELLAVDFTGPAAAITAFARLLREQGRGVIVVFSSVAGLRVRRENFVYGAAKAGLDGFCQGLSDALAGTGVRIVIVRPGFVATKMTSGRRPAPLATTKEDVADAIIGALSERKEVVVVPAILRPLFAVLVHLPQRLWRMVPG